MLAERRSAVPVLAKLEKPEAVAELDAVLAAFDGIMVARGDLGVEMPLERVPLVQKRVVQACREAAKPAIVATQMLESMIEHPRPTRAEASDVANAVLDGADAVMLSGETSIGRYPVQAVTTMARIVAEVEDDPAAVLPPLRHDPVTPAGAIAGGRDRRRPHGPARWRWPRSPRPATPRAGWLATGPARRSSRSPRTRPCGAG